jgi:hypothetical protein
MTECAPGLVESQTKTTQKTTATYRQELFMIMWGAALKGIGLKGEIAGATIKFNYSALVRVAMSSAAIERINTPTIYFYYGR